jgi:hypothetical protein
VWGAVYRLPCEEKPVLDQHEFLGVGYEQEQVEVVARRKTDSLRAWMYVAREDAIDSSLFPYSWYHEYIMIGAVEHRLPASYIAFLKSFESRADPDIGRHASNCRLAAIPH